MVSKSSQGRKENGNHKRQERRDLDLSQHEGFTFIPEQPSILKENQPAHYLYTYLGYKIELRFNEQWTAVCPHFSIETQFPHGKPNVIRDTLDRWVVEYILFVICPLPAVFELALEHNFTLDEAQVIFDERASR